MNIFASVQRLIFPYDDRDNIVAIADKANPPRNQSFGYDAMSRLISASGAYGSYAYEYDLVGNRTRRTVNALIEDYQYINGTHRLGSVTAAGVARSFSYQPSGQMAADNDNGIVTAFALDPEGRVNAVTRAGVAAASYIYDAFNLRIAKTVAAGIGDETGSIHFVYDLDGRLIAEHDGATGEPLREYVYYGLMPIALVSYDGTGNASVYAVHTDQVNMPQKLTDAGGAVVHDRVTTPFGETISVTGTLTQTLRFPGQRNDSETGLFQNWHRDYDASLGRYVQSDPIGLAGGINTYAYVGGNPVTYVDPTGELALIGFGVGALFEFGQQYFSNERRIECVDFGKVFISGALGSLGGSTAFLASGALRGKLAIGAFGGKLATPERVLAGFGAIQAGSATALLNGSINPGTGFRKSLEAFGNGIRSGLGTIAGKAYDKVFGG